MNRIVCLIMVIILASPFPSVGLQPVLTSFRGAFHKAAYKQGELIVKFKKHSIAKSVHRGVGGTVKASMRLFKSDLVSIPDGMTVKEAIRQYQNDPNVEYAEPNYLIRKAAIPDDPLFPSQWNLTQISAPRAWDTFTGSNATDSKIIAVLDTGIDYTHPDLIANLWINPGEINGNDLDDDGNGIVDDYYGARFKEGYPTSGDPMDDDTADSHGTHVSGIIAASGNNGTGVTGINWKARIMAVKFLHGPEGYGELSDALLGIEYALSKGASIINCSFEVAEDPSLSTGIKSLKDALQLADSKGALVVSAAGNTGTDLDFYNVYPASIQLPNNIAVAATGSRDQFPSYSDYGKSVVHVAAPGGDGSNIPGGVLSTVVLTDAFNSVLLYRTTAGTSMATPHVSGLAALIWNLYPNLNAYQIKARIMNSVDKLDSLADKTVTGGRINLERALKIGDLPAVFSVTPARVLPGSMTTINGVNFGASRGTVTLNGLPMTVSSWSNTSITATVPASAVSGAVLISGIGGSFPLSIPGLPEVTLLADPASGTSPLPVTFDAKIANSDVRIAKYEWDFGDGVFQEIDGVTTPATHTFTASGNYTIRVRLTDEFGRKVVNETQASVGTTASGGSSGGGGCFIATAAWGSELHPRVAALRSFRDRYLMTNVPGRLFVKAYYSVSPPIANFIARHEKVRAIVRCCLSPLVAVAEKL